MELSGLCWSFQETPWFFEDSETVRTGTSSLILIFQNFPPKNGDGSDLILKVFLKKKTQNQQLVTKSNTRATQEITQLLFFPSLHWWNLNADDAHPPLLSWKYLSLFFLWGGGKEEEFLSIDGLSAVNAFSNISNHTLVRWFNWEFCFFLSSDTITTVTCKSLGIN